jgi:hypothetical protein
MVDGRMNRAVPTPNREPLRMTSDADQQATESTLVEVASASRLPRFNLSWGLHWWGTALLLGLAFLIGNWNLVTGARVQIWDAVEFYTPAFSLVADHARAGRLLIWNPWLAAGTPDFADPQVGAASPILITVGAIVGGTSAAFRAYWLVIWFLGPLGLLLLARHLGAPYWAAFVLSLGYACSGFYTAHAEHTTVLYSFSFIPWFVWRFDVALSLRRFWPATQAGGLWGLSALGGYPAIVILSGGMLFLWGLGRCFTSEAASPPGATLQSRAKFTLLTLVLVFCIGVVVLAPTYVAFFFEGRGYSDRAGAMSRKAAIAATQNALQPGVLATFASPYLTALKLPYKNPGLWAGSDISVSSVYIGVLPLVFSLLALCVRPRSGWRWWLAGILGFSLACAVGDRLPVRGWLYDYCPPTRYFTHPGMFRGYAIFCAFVLAILAAKDIDSETRKSRTQIWIVLSAVSVVASLGALCAYISVMAHVTNLGEQFHRANRHLARIWFGAVAIFLILAIFRRTRKWLPLFLAILAIMDASLTLRLSQDFVSDAGWQRTLLNEVDASHKAALTMSELKRDLSASPRLGGSHTNINATVRVATFYNDSTMRNRFQLGFAEHPVLLNEALGKARVWFGEEAVVTAPTNYPYIALVNRSEQLGAPVLIVHSASEMAKASDVWAPQLPDAAQLSAISRLPQLQHISVQLLRYTPNHLELKVDCPRDGWLLVTDRWAAGWRAKVNRRPAEVFGGNLIFRAVRVQAGENIVQFTYSQRLYMALVVVSWTVLLAVFILPSSLGHFRGRLFSAHQ